VITASRKISVRPAIRMFSAISFGVFCRSPLDQAIMRSGKSRPVGSDAYVDLIREHLRASVTALRSPPDSRSPAAFAVMTDSSTVAMPSITSPSRNDVAGFADHTSPERSLEAGTAQCVRDHAPGDGIGLGLAQRIACALPRASAIASAKFANST